MIVGGLLLGAGYVGVSLATDFNQVLVIFGVLIAPANVLIGPVAMTVLLSRWFARRRGRAVGIAIAGISAGGFFFPMIIQGLFNANEWREALRLLAVILVAWTIPAACLVVDRPTDRGLNPDGDAQPPAHGARGTGESAVLGARPADRSGVLVDRGDHCDRDIGHERHDHQSRSARHRHRHHSQPRGDARLGLLPVAASSPSSISPHWRIGWARAC